MKNSQNGSAALWVIIIIVVILAVGGYLYYLKNSQIVPASVTNSVSTNQSAVTQAPNTSTSGQTSTTVSEQTNTTSGSNDCGKYVSAEDITNVFSYNTLATVKTKVHSAVGDCTFYWAAKASDLTDYNEDGYINFSAQNDAIAINTIETICKNEVANGSGVSANIGTISCVGPTAGILTNAGLSFIKDGIGVGIYYSQNMPPDNVRAKLLIQLAQLIASRI